MRKWFIRILWILLVLVLLGTGIIFWLIANGSIGYMPPIEDLQSPINKYATQVYSADGKLLGTWSLTRQKNADSRDRMGMPVEYEELSPYLVKALVATEDERFFSHAGIDFYALGRAFFKGGLFGKSGAGGGSTITQQLAKQIYSPEPSSTLERLQQKANEWAIAVKLERNYTKEEIIAMYFNYFDFLYEAVGIKAAADTYFSKTPADLTVTEAATLVGMFKASRTYNPKKNPENSKARRNVVLGQMLKAGYITQAEHDSCCQEPLTLKFHVINHREGEGTYFRTFLSQYMMAKKPDMANYRYNPVKFVMDSIAWQEDPLYGWCNKNKKADGTPYNIYNDGLKVYTTIDSRMQKYAEEACYEHLVNTLQPEFNKSVRNKKNAPYPNSLSASEIQRIMNRNIRQSERYRIMKANDASDAEIEKAFNTKVPMTVFTYKGEVDTMMTPRDSILYYKTFLRTGFYSMEPQTGQVKAYVGGLDLTHFAYDMATLGRRQVGSTIKPFLYSLAMANNWTPCDEVLNDQRTYYTEANQAWTPRNGSNARRGEMVSLKWGLQQSNNWVSAALIDTLKPSNFVDLLHQYGLRNPDIKPTLSLCLGTCELTVAEMVSAYTTFINHGLRASPMYVTRIVDNDGKVYDFTPRLNMVLAPDAADKMLYMLRAVVDGGTANRLRFRYNLTAPIGGKTGTTNDNSDGWFMGVTPQLVSGCWVGGEDRDIHFDSMTFGQGASAALPIFALYMRSLYNDSSLPQYNQSDAFDLPAGFDPCYNEDFIEEEEPGEEVTSDE